MIETSSIYEGIVFHQRLRPKKHRLTYKVFSLLLDLDDLGAVKKFFPLFSINRWGIFSFFEKDHGSMTGTPLKTWVEEQVKSADIEFKELKVKLLCYPRVLGYGFNPLSIYFCYSENEQLVCVIYEVCNTFLERHSYIIPVTSALSDTIKQSCKKELYVSPFVDMNAEYRFEISPPDRGISVLIKENDEDGVFLIASFVGKRRNITGLSLFKYIFQYPFMSAKIILGIHWEAVKLWLKGLPYIAHSPADRKVASSKIRPDTRN